MHAYFSKFLLSILPGFFLSPFPLKWRRSLFLPSYLYPLFLPISSSIQTNSFPPFIIDYFSNLNKKQQIHKSTMAGRAQTERPLDQFEDFFPVMADKLGEEGLMQELVNGFRVLMDPRVNLITFESLKRNAASMGLDGLSDEELRLMVREGDFDGDGALNEMEFCVLMVRLSPELMEAPRRLLDSEFQEVFGFELGLGFDH
ncbi:hypothetical protein LUZ60_017423 [Juncus effusus]|nr:hypothetical protein LUZ60_017423 [Juncus effusus]